MRGVFQELSYKLSINRKPFSIEGAIKSGHSLFASITTTDALIERFRNIVLTAGIDAETIRVFLPRHNLFIEHLPEASHRSPQCLRRTRPLVKILRAHRRPIAAYSVNRTRPSQATAALGKDLAEMDAQVALGLYSKNELKGMVTMAARRSGRIYSATDQDALQVLCDQLAVAIENAQLYTEVQNNKIYNDILVDNLVSGLIAANQEGLITIMNREAQRIADLSAPRALGSRLDVLPEPFAGALRQTLDKANPIKEQEAVIERNDREPIPVRMGSSPFFSSTGEPLGALLVFADLSEQKKLESQVRRSDRLASVGTLSAGMAHEIKNPLVTIKTFAELLPERFQDKEFRETFSSLVSHEVQRIDRLVNQLLHFARPAQADLRPASLHTTVQSAMVLIEEQLHRNHIRLELNLHAENDGILGDENLLSQALINLLFNAIDSMESGGTLAVETRHTPLPWPLQEQAGPHPPDGRIYLCLSIRDSGSGIAKDALGQIFDPFFTTKHHGTGLGLAISHGIIKEHRAVIDVESQLGIGTTFFLYFPLVTPGVTA
jgi:PAS domain S-box-containing protein